MLPVLVRWFLFLLLESLMGVTLRVWNRADFIVAVDVGHSLKEGGALSARGVPEFLFNRDLAEAVISELNLQGFRNLFLIGVLGDALTLKERAQLALAKRANLLVSLHHDSVQPKYLSTWIYEQRQLSYCDRFHGYSIFYSERNGSPKASLEFAHLLGEELRNSGCIPSLHHAENIKGERRQLLDGELGTYRFDDLVVLKSSAMPAVLLEAGIIVNRAEEVRLADPQTQKLMAASIARAVVWFSLND